MSGRQAVETGMAYPWQRLSALPVNEQAKVLELRREELLEKTETEGVTSQIAEEWVALLTERDVVLRKCLEEENVDMLDSQLKSVLKSLVTIGKLDHTRTPLSLKQALFNIYSQLCQYFANKDQDGDDEDTETTENMTILPDRCTGTSHQTVPPPPPLPSEPVSPNRPKPSSAKRVKLDEESVEASTEKKGRRRKPVPRGSVPLSPTKPSSKLKAAPKSRLTPGSKYTPRQVRTPKRVDSEDLRRHLLTGRDQLKSIPGMKRSPGGTPERSKGAGRSAESPSDLVSVALQRKFVNVRRLYTSPVKDDDDEVDSREASFNISID